MNSRYISIIYNKQLKIQLRFELNCNIIIVFIALSLMHPLMKNLDSIYDNSVAKHTHAVADKTFLHFEKLQTKLSI